MEKYTYEETSSIITLYLEENGKALASAEKELDRLSTANLQISQQVQNATIIGAVRPTPIPAYNVASPYCPGYEPCYGK